MKKLTFGLNAEINNEHANLDFKTYVGKDGADENPYGGNFFSDPAHLPAPNRDANCRITSVPSPYARMHLTDLAFEELNTYQGNAGQLSTDYVKAISHCLDMFELFFRFDKLDLLEKGIKVERSELITKSLNNKWRAFFDKYPQVVNYIETLDLYRKQYLDVISLRDPANNFKFTFTDMYVFRDSQNRIFGATSPFTGFFTTATCNLAEYDITVIEEGGIRHKLFTANPEDWMMLRERSSEFQDFMYILLNPDQQQGGLGKVFHNLWVVVDKVVENRREQLKTKNFFETYPRFNFTNAALPRLYMDSQEEIYVRSSEMDSSYLKYLLFFNVTKPIRFAIKKELYDIPVQNRHFPDDSETTLPWIGVNDVLSDALFVLPYELNDDYVGVNVIDENNHSSRRCLLPIKSSALRYFPELLQADEVDKRISIRKYADGHYTVSIIVYIRTATNDKEEMILRREYWPHHYDDDKMISGRVYLPEENNNFALGIYPFVKSTSDLNIYKVLFYNQLKGKLSTDDVALKFYHLLQGEYVPYRFDSTTECRMNYTEEYDPNKADSINTAYYHVEDNTIGDGIAFIELCVRDEDMQKVRRLMGTSLIVPVMREQQAAQVNNAAIPTHIAIDLGTSNTYVAYQHGTNPIEEINMVDADGKAELRFMHKPVRPTKFQISERYQHDLYLQPASGTDAPMEEWTKCIARQLCEFIPTAIKENIPENFNNAFSFPIPTIISALRYKGTPNVNSDVQENKPLIHSTIPFAYYDVGKRPFDAPKGDFKWFVDSQTAMFTTNGERENLQLFVSELLFIIRSHMLYKGYALQDCDIVWTYPLAFNDQLQAQTEIIWRSQFLKYFRSNAKSFLNQPDRYPDIENLVHSTNESLSPFYYCVAQTKGGHAYQVLLDIGGGSTDVIGYDKGEPQFISSFNFAGNDLYAEQQGQQNYSANTNVIRKAINSLYQQMQAQMEQTEFSDTQRIGIGESLSALMNYGFQKFPNEFAMIWNNAKLHYLLKFHTAAIVYQTAQLCRLVHKEGTPYMIHLTGNGSKLFNLLPKAEREEMFYAIFAKVYHVPVQEINLNFSSIANPKFAAARGSLLGYKEMFEDGMNTQVRQKSYVSLGDGQEIRLVSNKAVAQDAKAAMRTSVSNNVKEFIDLFYSLPSDVAYPLPKKVVLDYLNQNTENNPKLVLRDNVRNLFFEYIKDLMIGVSARLC